MVILVLTLMMVIFDAFNLGWDPRTPNKFANILSIPLFLFNSIHCYSNDDDGNNDDDDDDDGYQIVKL